MVRKACRPCSRAPRTLGVGYEERGLVTTDLMALLNGDNNQFYQPAKLEAVDHRVLNPHWIAVVGKASGQVGEQPHAHIAGSPCMFQMGSPGCGRTHSPWSVETVMKHARRTRISRRIDPEQLPWWA